MDGIAIGYSRQIVAESVKKQIGYSDRSKVVEYSYRPFNKQWLYYDRETNQRQYRIPAIFPPEEAGKSGIFGNSGGNRRYPNKVIWVKSPGGSKDFSCLITDCIPDIQPDGGIQCISSLLVRENRARRFHS